MGKINIGCKKATYLLSKREQNKIDFFDRLKLFIHLFICDVCRRFEIQIKIIIKINKENKGNEKLSEDGKRRITRMLIEE